MVSALIWSPWQSLDSASSSSKGEHRPGLYRIRWVEEPRELLYIGQTGTSLYKRLSHLGRLYTSSEMPYNDPHTVAPALWALYQDHGRPYEVSVCPLDLDTPQRKAMECLAIADYRQALGASPKFNFGRMPLGWRKSSGNNATLVKAGKRFRGHRTTETLNSHTPSLPPTAKLSGLVSDSKWCGHTWSEWSPLASVSPFKGTGLYRLKRSQPDLQQGSLLYVGQGKVFARLQNHQRTAEGSSKQAQAFGITTTIECSWAIDTSWLSSQLLELENDLIAAHTLHLGFPPPGQFIG